MTATIECTKRAWIRDAGTEPGRSGPGRISCPCGNAPLSYYGDGRNVTCACGTLYDSTGVILSPKLLICCRATGTAYCDSSREVDGDYALVAFLPYDTMELQVYEPGSPLAQRIVESAAYTRSQKGVPIPFAENISLSL